MEICFEQQLKFTFSSVSPLHIYMREVLYLTWLRLEWGLGELFVCLMTIKVKRPTVIVFILRLLLLSTHVGLAKRQDISFYF